MELITFVPYFLKLPFAAVDRKQNAEEKVLMSRQRMSPELTRWELRIHFSSFDSVFILNYLVT